MGLPAKRHLMAFCWRANHAPGLNACLVAAIPQGIWTCNARKPYICDFSGGGGVGTPYPPSGSAHGIPTSSSCHHFLV